MQRFARRVEESDDGEEEEEEEEAAAAVLAEDLLDRREHRPLFCDRWTSVARRPEAMI